MKSKFSMSIRIRLHRQQETRRLGATKLWTPQAWHNGIRSTITQRWRSGTPQL
jgi:hypothetical protein